jgi:hypothetical protein
MSARKSPLLLRVPSVVLREQRVFRLHFFCEACTDVGSEWVEEALVVRSGYCPCCDTECEPYSTEEFYEERPEFDLSDELDKALDAMDEANKAMEECRKAMAAFRKVRGL